MAFYYPGNAVGTEIFIRNVDTKNKNDCEISLRSKIYERCLWR